MLGYIDGKLINLQLSIPIIEGKDKEDLNSFRSTQIRTYKFGTTGIKNTPNGARWSWFTIEIIMQDEDNGTMLLFTDEGQMFFRGCEGAVWKDWHEFAFK